MPAVPRCVDSVSLQSPAAPACSAPAQPLAALAIKAALRAPVAPVRDKQMFLSSEAGSSSSARAVRCVLGRASLARSRALPRPQLRSGRDELQTPQPHCPASLRGKILASALACMGMAILVCHLSSQLNLEMTKEQNLTSPALAHLSSNLWSAAALPEPSASPPGQSIPLGLPGSPALSSVLQVEGVQEKSLSSCPQVQAGCFI